MIISGTGKTLSLLCATLGWISKQTEIRNEWVSNDNGDDSAIGNEKEAIEPKTFEVNDTDDEIMVDMPDEATPMSSIPTVHFASRTHSQISQGKHDLFGA